MSNISLGIDVGATGIKSALVDVPSGTLITPRMRIDTPHPATIQNVTDVIKKMLATYEWTQAVGIGFPAIVKKGVCYSAANIDDEWLNFPIESHLSEILGLKVVVENDADVAGRAEMKYGAGKYCWDTAIMITVGTGLGSALFHRGILFPNTEFGHIPYRDGIFEDYASNRTRKDKKLTWKKWGSVLSDFLQVVEMITAADLIVLGGGVSKKFEFYNEYLEVSCEVRPAKLENTAGIVGAAFLAHTANYSTVSPS
jgi:polyphosphate glucokinase